MVTLTTARNTSKYSFTEAAAMYKKNFPKKPANGGIPASENKANNKAKANFGFVLYKPV